MKKKNKTTAVAVNVSFYVDEGEVAYQANVHPKSGAWFAVLNGRLGSAPGFPEGCNVPIDVRPALTGAVQHAARIEYDRLKAAIKK